ncbi:MAG: YraN family protein [Candidatus Omnitrophota bacterium]
MDRTRQITGRLGEKIAGRFLASRGFIILRRNFSTPFGEIDLIAEKNGCIIFLEVKTRTSERFGPPLSSVTKTKQEHIIRNCQYYLKRYGLHGKPCRIDAIAVNLEPGGKLEKLEHVKNAIEI